MIDPTELDFAQRASIWLHGHDTGSSSKAIFHYMTLGVKGGSVPLDASDLGRCIRLLEAFPEWLPRMPEMANVSGAWAHLMPRWDKIVETYQAEKAEAKPSKWGGWDAPKTYDLMTEARYEEPGVVYVRF